MCLAMSHLYAVLPMLLVRARSLFPPMAGGSVLDCHFKSSIYLRRTRSWARIGLWRVDPNLSMVVSVDRCRQAWTVCRWVIHGYQYLVLQLMVSPCFSLSISLRTSTCSQNYHAFLYLFQLKATQAGSLYASDSILSTTSGSHQCPINLEAVTDCFTNENSLLYCFINDDDAMQNLMLTHGFHVRNLDRTDGNDHYAIIFYTDYVLASLLIAI